MLRQTGYSSLIRPCIAGPESGGAIYSDIHRDLRVEIGIRRIAWVKNWLVHGPFNAKCRVVPARPPRGARIVEFRHLIRDVAIVFESHEAVSHSFGDIE